MTVNTSDDTFEQDVLKADRPVLVDFWAEWCAPCRTMAPVLEETEKSYGDRLTVAKLNVDDNPHTPQNFSVRGIPTLVLFKDGKALDQRVGAMPKAALQRWIDEQLESAA